MAEAAVSAVVSTVGELLAQEAKFLYDVRDKVEQLRDKLRAMTCLLKEVDSRQCESDLVREYVSSIRQAAYDAEDVIDTYVVKLDSRSRGSDGGEQLGIVGCVRSVLQSCFEFVTNLKEVHDVGVKIKSINSRVSRIHELMRADCGVVMQEAWARSASAVQQVRILQRRTTPYDHEGDDDHLVGLKPRIEKLARVLLDRENCFWVVSIHGMGGLGKTTLARGVFHCKEVRHHFERFAWIYVSEKCDPKSVWQEMCRQLCFKDNTDGMTDGGPIDKLQKVLRDNRCLVILDDIWGPDDWDLIYHAFPRKTGSKILLTSRNENVGTHIAKRGFHYSLDRLNEADSWELFQKKGLSEMDDLGPSVLQRMKELGREMVKHCAGLPLAISVLGGHLATKCLEEWERIHKNIKPYILKGNIGGQKQRRSPVFYVLALSYNDLEPHLKQCFLYLAYFPEDYKIDVDKLIKYWIAEGMVILTQHHYGGHDVKTTLEDIAESYFEELVKKSMLEVEEISETCRTCRMHDLVRDLCLEKAKEEIFLQALSPWVLNELNEALYSSSTGRVRRLGIHMEDWRDSEGLEKISIFLQNSTISSCLRALVFTVRRMSLPSLSKFFFEHLKLLRVLDLHCICVKSEKPLDDIGELILLRYLSLTVFDILELPLSLGNLKKLLVLECKTNKAVRFPNVICKMQNLRHLSLPNDIIGGEGLEISNLIHLVTLENFPIGLRDGDDLLKLTSLKDLSIRIYPECKNSLMLISSSVRKMLKNLCSFSVFYSWRFYRKNLPRPPSDVRELVSGFANLSKLKLYIRMQQLPDEHQLPLGITSITLAVCELQQDYMATLGKLPNLEYLELRSDAFLGAEIVFPLKSFQKLKALRLDELTNLKELRIEEGSMVHLLRLTIFHCKGLKMLPQELRFILTLKELEFVLMTKDFKSKLVAGGEDFYKVQHVPSVVFRGCD